MEYRIEPCCQGALTGRRLLRNPRDDHWLYRHPPPRGKLRSGDDGCGRSKTKIVCLEDEIYIGAKLNAFSIGHREQAVAVQNVVECFNRFGINVTIANDPIVRVGRLFDLPASTGGQHTIEPLPGDVVHVPQKTDPGHGFGVHDVHDVLLVLPLVGICEHYLEYGLPATRGPNDTNVHSLITSYLMELEHFGNLRVNVLEFHLFHCLSNVDL